MIQFYHSPKFYKDVAPPFPEVIIVGNEFDSKPESRYLHSSQSKAAFLSSVGNKTTPLSPSNVGTKEAKLIATGNLEN
jgi:hypothetical protein